MLVENSIETSVGSATPGVATRERRDPAQSRAKRVMDIVLSLAALVALSVILIIIAAAIAVLEGRPILIRHNRVGKGGVPFGCLKFRTMVTDADAALARHLAANQEAVIEWHATHKLRNDPRITPIGKVLRETSLDELPQLLNILRGDMSLVGPRPIVAAEMPRYGAASADYLAVRPGLTGLWQCSGRNDVSYDQRVLLDKQYVRTWSVRQDLMIMLRTVPAVVRSRGVY